jgi:hypothetical protein
MPSESVRVTKRFTLREVETFPECISGFPDPTYQNRYEDTLKVWADHVRRPRPEGLEKILNPTALPLQYTLYQRQGLYKFATVESIGSCRKVIDNKYGNVSVRTTDQAKITLPYDGVPRHQATEWPLAMRLKIKDRKVNLGTSLVEYRQTSKMFDGFARGLHTAWKSYKQARRLGLTKGREQVIERKRGSGRRGITPCDIPASYLTATYGIEPLLGDLMDSIQALEKRLELPVYQRFAVRRSSSKVDHAGISWQTSEKAVCYLELVGHFDPFTLGNVQELAWEVIPFSFVVDWSIGVGDWLSALDALDGWIFKSGTVTSKTRGEGEKNSDWTGGTLIEPAKVLWEGHKRSVLNSIPFPPRPTVTVSSSYRRLANAVSLLWAVNERCSNAPIR